MTADKGTRKSRAPSGSTANRIARDVAPPALWLFDFDNTLAGLEAAVDWAAARRELEPAMRAAHAPERLFEKFPRRNLVLYDAWRLELDASQALNRAARAALRRASAIIEKYELAGVDLAAPLNGALDLIGVLDRGGATVGIVTSNSSRTVERWLKRNRVRAAVDFIVGRDTLLPLKPAPDMLSRALEATAITAARTVFVGDSEADAIAARAANIRFVGIAATSDARSRLAAAGAAEIFDSPAALLSHLNLIEPPGVIASIARSTRLVSAAEIK
ncbi:MAG TPA: HAD-IA family hydrolase [Candidatus Binataceae bacterium]|nr:HAD-IA family hydrolase [Candidatus Binataceae bacterium]